MFDSIDSEINIPIIHIADETGKKIVNKKIKNIGLLGTKYTLNEDFYKTRLKEKFSLNVLIPNEDEIKVVHDIIVNDLAHNKINESAKNKYIKIINNLIEKGAEGIILGCTEIPLLISQNDVDVPVFDTTFIHAHATVDFAQKQKNLL